MPERQAQSSQILGQLRDTFISHLFLLDSKDGRRKFTPMYSNIAYFEQALVLTQNIDLFLASGLSPTVILNYFSTVEGLAELEKLVFQYNFGELKELKGLKSYLDQISDATRQKMFLALHQDPEIFKWIMRGFQVQEPAQASWKLCRWLNRTSVLDDKTLVHFLLSLISEVNPYRSVLFECMSLQDLTVPKRANLIEAMNLFKTDSAKISRFQLVVPFLILNHLGVPQAEATWGARLQQLDFIRGFIPGGNVDFYTWELVLANLYKQAEQTQLTPWGLASEDLRKTARYARKNLLPDPLETRETLSLGATLEDESVYQAFDRQESAAHPLHHLMTWMGVEAEVQNMPEVNKFSKLMADFVVLKGGGNDFEYSADPVKHAGTLVAFYDRLFKSGLIDLLHRRDFSLHLNSGTLSKSLTIESQACLMLTGLISQGRKKGGDHYSMTSATFIHSSSRGARRLEWKQGDLIHPETFFLACNLWSPLVSAQRAYEECALILLLDKDPSLRTKNADQHRVALETEVAKEILNKEEIWSIDALKVSPEKKQLAVLYSSFRRLFRKNLNAAGIDGKVLSAVLAGEDKGMEVCTDWLMEVFPTLDSFITVDPELELQKMNHRRLGRFKSHQKTALEVVASSRALLTRIMRSTHSFLGETEELYEKIVLKIAKQVLETDDVVSARTMTAIIQRFPCDQQSLLEKAEIDPDAITLALAERFEWVLGETDLNEEDRQTLVAARDLLLQPK